MVQVHLARDAGFSDVDAVGVYHAFIDLTLAFAALDAGAPDAGAPDAGAPDVKDEARGADEGMWTSTYARLPSETHPHIAATAHLLADRTNLSACPVVLDTLPNQAEDRLAAARHQARGTG